MRASIRRSLLCAAAALGACAGGERPAQTLLVTHRLADEVAQARGESEAATANVGDVTRYVPIAPVVQVVHPPAGESPDMTADSEGVLRIGFRCPPALAGRPAVAQVILPSWSRDDVITCPRDAGASLPLAVGGRRPGERVGVIVLVRGMPADRAETGWLRVPPAAVLRVALGGADPAPAAEATPTRFRLLGESRQGARVTLLEETLDPARRADDRTWRDFEIALDAVGDDDLRFVFESEAAGAGTRPAFAVWGDPLVLGRAPGPAPPNVVLVSLDTLRPDALGCYGRARPTSPALDRLAREGTLFEVAVAPAPWTLPSHLTMLTGLHGCVHGLEKGGLGHRLSPGIRPLADFLRAHGYATAAFTENAYMEAAVFQRGFGLYRANASSDPAKVEDTVASARTWLAAHAQVSFFLFVHTYQTHGPYSSPASYRAMFASSEEPAPTAAWPSPVYDAAVRYTDTSLAALFADVDQLGLAERTLVVVTSDHGEAFGEHGHHGHGKSLHEEEVRVPFIWRGPGRVAAGRRVGDLVGLIDVTPTILDLVGIEAPPGLTGRSLVPWLATGGPAPVATPRTLFSENRLRTPQLAVRTERWKAIFENGTRRLFSLATDPGEDRPVHDGPELEEALRMRERFEADCQQQRATVGHDAAPLPSLLPPDPQQQERLRALGYVE
jgi:arylsulfatase A-like enzyme